MSQHQRRMRTKFTSEQIRKLESTFSKHRYLGALQRRTIAERLSLSEIQVGAKVEKTTKNLAQTTDNRDARLAT